MTKKFTVFGRHVFDGETTYTYETSNPEEIALIGYFLKATFDGPRLYGVANGPMFKKDTTPQLIETVNSLIEKIKAYVKNSSRDDIPELPEMEPISLETPYEDISDLVSEIFDFIAELTGLYLYEDEEAYSYEIEDIADKVKLWKFEWDSGFSFIGGLFVATDEELKNLIGEEINLGEVEGKHSEVYGTVEECDISLVSDDPVVIDAVGNFGINPLWYLDDE